MSKSKAFLLFFEYIPRFLSVVLHPLLMTLLGILILLFFNGTNAFLIDGQEKYYVIALVAAFTFIIPLAFMPFYYYFKISTTVLIDHQQDRIIPLLVTTIVYYVCFLLFHMKGAPHLIQAFLFSSTLAVFMNLLVTFHWKISAHMIGVGGITGLLFSLSTIYHIDTMGILMVAILLSGLVAFSRLSLNAHTPAQIYAGFFLGFAITVGVLFIY